MTVKSIAVALCLGWAIVPVSPALAEDNEAGQKPPVEQQAGQKPPEEPKCITSKTDWKQNGKAMAFVIELENACEMRLRCTVEAYVLGSRGPAQGQGTLILAPKSKGADAIKAYSLKVKSAGGMANVSHSCKAI